MTISITMELLVIVLTTIYLILYKLNGVCDITEQSFSHLFFREEQVQKYHSRKPKKNIYVYSFDIEPESTQPSGFINFSRDTSKSLSFNFTGLESSVKLHLFASHTSI